MSTPWRVVDSGLELAVRLTPKGGRNACDGVGVDASGRAVLLIRVSAPPIDGAANKALIKLLSKTLGVSKSSVRFISGENARIKRLSISGNCGELISVLTKFQVK